MVHIEYIKVGQRQNISGKKRNTSSCFLNEVQIIAREPHSRVNEVNESAYTSLISQVKKRDLYWEGNYIDQKKKSPKKQKQHWNPRN